MDRRVRRDLEINDTEQVSQSLVQCFFYETVQSQIAHSLAATLCKYPQPVILFHVSDKGSFAVCNGMTQKVASISAQRLPAFLFSVK